MAIRFDLPKAVRWSGNYCRLAGRGKAPGCWIYSDVGTGRTIELFAAKILFVNGSRAFAGVESNQALGNIEIERRDFHVGDLLLVGPLIWRFGRCYAETAWPVGFGYENDFSHATLVEWHGDRGFGRLLASDGKSYFVHISSFATGIIPNVGFRYAFRKEGYGNRLTAKNVRNS